MMDTCNNNTKRRRGFSLMEVLITMGIFTIGMVTVAAIFPVGVLLQRQTIAEVESEQLRDNARAMLRARPFVDADIPAAPSLYRDTTQVLPWTDVMWDQWSLTDRVYLSKTFDPAQPQLADYFWVPVIRATVIPPAPNQFVMYAFIVQRDSQRTYDPTASSFDQANHSGLGVTPADPNQVPKVIRMSVNKLSGKKLMVTNVPQPYDTTGHGLGPGDLFLDSVGNVQTIKEVSGNEITVRGLITDDQVSGLPPVAIWAVPRVNGRSPLLAIEETITDVVVP